MTGAIPALAGGIFGDLWSLAIPVGGNAVSAAAGAALDQLLRKRLEAARAIQLDELRRGEIALHELDAEEAAAIFYRYLRAAQEGAARINLRLMAKVIAGQARLGDLRADLFLGYAEMLAGLRREEIILISALYKEVLEHAPDSTKPGDATAKMSKTLGAIQEDLKQRLIDQGVFTSSSAYMATAFGLLRTGLLIADVPIGGFIFRISPLCHRLILLASFEQALSDEPEERREPML